LYKWGQTLFVLITYIAELLRANVETIKASKLICDLRTPSVPSFVVAAIEAAMEGADVSMLQEVVIVE